MSRTMVEKLAPAAISEALKGLEGWAGDEGGIRKTFEFKNFSRAWAFMSRVALLAEKMDHHPEWLNVYNTVDVTLRTHTAQGVTPLDLEMAQKMNVYYSAGA